MKQHGSVLVFCLVFLALLTMTATVSMEAAITEQRAAGRMQDYQIALQAAEVALATASEWLAELSTLPPASADGSTKVWQATALDPDVADGVPWWQDSARQQSWWETNAQVALEMQGLAAPPRYVIEALAPTVYRVTARGSGRAALSSATVQSIHLVGSH